MYDQLSTRLSDSSVRQTHAVLSKALGDAFKQGLIEDNPMTRLISKPTVTRKEMDTLTADEAKALLAINDRWTPMFTLMIYTGMRLGEVLGLRWKDVDLDDGVIKVRQTVGYGSTGLEYGEPKTDKSRRDIPIHATVINALKNTARVIGPRNLVFPNEQGEGMYPSRPHNALQKALKSIGVDRNVRLHDLRHTAASLMIQQGASVKAVQDILGHADYSTTMNVYVHSDQEMLAEGTATLEKLFGT